MTRIGVHSELQYAVSGRCAFAFALVAQHTVRQTVVEEDLAITPTAEVRRDVVPAGHDIVRVTAGDGPLTVRYDAVVELQPHTGDRATLAESRFELLPSGILTFLNPSRYCESDRLERFARHSFGDLRPGYERVVAVCNWVYDHLEYVPGSTDGSTTAIDVLVTRAGVCRDFAHLSIAVCRALGIPARYVSGYAVDLEPPDFHGFMEAYLGDRWFLFDATRMAPIDRLVRIAAGHDAADVAFGTLFGAATLESMVVSVIDLERSGPDERKSSAPTSTA
jgi:transglutaminase-like putative cysteine protease